MMDVMVTSGAKMMNVTVRSGAKDDECDGDKWS